jgi:deaminated glutathione amidase
MKVGVIQICSVLEPSENIAEISKFIEQAKSLAVEAIFLPECFYSMSDGTGATPYLVENQNEHYEAIRNLSVKHEMYILGGSAATLVDGDVVNRAYNFDPQGKDLGTYDKIHLFSCDIEKNGKRVQLNEGNVYTAGKESKIVNAGQMNIGLGICFDVRYPNMFRDYAEEGANVLSIPAAFTVPSGKAHWHVLQRARAIESQCFVIAAAQWGCHNDKIETYGHSLIIDPWGTVLADAGEGEKLIVADLDLSMIAVVRDSIKLF